MSTFSFVPTPAPQALSPIPDPALTAQTFLRNPRLTAALARLQAQRASQNLAPAPLAALKPVAMPGINTGAESEGSDDADPNASPCPTDRAFLYLVQFKTADNCLTEGYRVRATDITTAIENATQQAAPKHPRTALRVVSARELDERQ